VQTPGITLIFFFYGLAFFSMGLAVTLEWGRAQDTRLRHALRPLAGFGLIHATHEWIEMFDLMGHLPFQEAEPLVWEIIRIAILAFSFLSLGAFGASLLAPNERLRRMSLLVPLVQAAVWGFGALVLRGWFTNVERIWSIIDVWTRYVLAAPSALLACAGLIAQQRAFRRAGLVRFGRDSLWAAVAFAWYGIIGQVFTRPSALPPSTVVNQDLFLDLFGFPIQLLRAGTAGVAAIFVIRFLRAFEVEQQNQIAALQAARLQEAERREALRGDLLQRVVAAQEAERQRIARELHDETGQSLTAIGLGLRGASTTLRVDADKAAHNLRQLESLVAHALNELQRLIADLRPSHLDDLGLPSAVRWYAGEVQNRVPLQVSVEVVGEPHPTPPAVTIALFRMVQEALTNVVKHAAARNVKVRLCYADGSVGASIEDDGRGFDIAQVSRPDRPSWGLLGMHERASLLGGTLSVESQPGAGTRVEVRIPYQQTDEGIDDHSTAAGG
jgi:signal transduction histidine kinase